MNPRDLPVSSALVLGLQMCTAAFGFWCGFWRFEFRFSCLHSKLFTDRSLPSILPRLLNQKTVFLIAQQYPFYQRKWLYIRAVPALLFCHCHDLTALKQILMFGKELFLPYYFFNNACFFGGGSLNSLRKFRMVSHTHNLFRLWLELHLNYRFV